MATIATETNGTMANGTATPKKERFTRDLLSGDMIFESPADFQAHAIAAAAAFDESPVKGKNRPCLLLYKGHVYDATEFTTAHPGGAELMEMYNGKDITITFHDEYNQHAHTNAALNMMLQYRAGRVLHGNPVKSSGGSTEQQLEEFEVYKLEELTAYPKMTETELIYTDFTIRRDRGLVWQAMFLTLPQYYHLIETPIYCPSCKLFDTAFIEPFSRTKYWLVAALWLPLSLFWSLRAVLKDYSQSSPSILNSRLYYPNNGWLFRNYPHSGSEMGDGVNGTAVAAAQLQHAQEMSKFCLFNVFYIFGCGILLWTFTEYCLHRFLFHFERLVPVVVIDNPIAKLLHLVIHGIHHIIPMDPDRLVFPPVLFLVASFLIYNFFGFFLAGSFLDMMAGGVVFGYVCYDEIHYLIHHVEPKDFYFKDLKKYHHAHHYTDDTRGFGISNKLWDFVFGTECRKA